MGSLDDLGHDEYDLLARLAFGYYEEGLTQEELAREFGLSRPKVQRLLVRARATGVVDIRITPPPWLHLDLEHRIREAYGLREVLVATERPDAQAQREEVARVAGAYLGRRLDAGTTVAVGHGRDAAEVARWFNPARRLGATFVSAMGGSPLVSSPTNPNEIARRLADRCGGRSVELFAPAFVESERMRDELLRQHAVAETLDQAANASVALVGVGGIDDDCTMVRSGCFSIDEIRRLRAAGAVGDVLGHYVDAAGRRLESPETQRLVSLGLDELHAIDTVVVVVSEAEKPRAILGVLRTGVVDVLAIDEGNARFLAEAAQQEPVRPGSEV